MHLNDYVIENDKAFTDNLILKEPHAINFLENVILKRLENTKRFSYSALALWVFLLSSCGEGLEIEIDIPEKPASLVVNSTLVPFSLPMPKNLGIELSSSTSIFDTIDPTHIKNANVLLYKNNVFVDTLKYNSYIKMYPLGYKPFEGPQPGDTYEITILADKFQSISAKTIIPDKVEIISYQIVPVAFIDDLGAAWSEIILTFKDPPGKANFYEIVVGERLYYAPETYFPLLSHESFITREAYYPSPVRFDLKKPNYLLFNDSSFDGDEKTLSIYYYPPQFMEDKRYVDRHIGNIQFRNVSEEYYLFKTSWLQGLYNQKEDILYGMGEPMNVFTNIENGYGIFAGFNDCIIPFLVDETLISTMNSEVDK